MLRLRDGGAILITRQDIGYMRKVINYKAMMYYVGLLKAAHQLTDFMLSSTCSLLCSQSELIAT